MIFVFDLDGTVIDSTHRAVAKPDGSFCLDGWRKNCTEALIMADSLLPLADVMRRYFREGHTIVVCTARICQTYDMQFLYTHGLQFHHFLSRDPDDMRGDAEYKTDKLNGLAASLGWPDDWRRGACMFDDNVKVIRQMIADRLYCFDAIKYNARLAAQAA